MVDSLTFRLLETAIPVRPVLRLVEDIQYKDYVLTVTFDGSNLGLAKGSAPAGLHWSTTLDCAFVYLPEAKASTTLRLPEFVPPTGALSATLSVAPWAEVAQQSAAPVSEIVLETSVIDRPAVIVGEEG